MLTLDEKKKKKVKLSILHGNEKAHIIVNFNYYLGFGYSFGDTITKDKEPKIVMREQKYEWAVKPNFNKKNLFLSVYMYLH